MTAPGPVRVAGGSQARTIAAIMLIALLVGFGGPKSAHATSPGEHLIHAAPGGDSNGLGEGSSLALGSCLTLLAALMLGRGHAHATPSRRASWDQVTGASSLSAAWLTAEHRPPPLTVQLR